MSVNSVMAVLESSSAMTIPRSGALSTNDWMVTSPSESGWQIHSERRKPSGPTLLGAQAL